MSPGSNHQQSGTIPGYQSGVIQGGVGDIDAVKALESQNAVLRAHLTEMSNAMQEMTLNAAVIKPASPDGNMAGGITADEAANLRTAVGMAQGRLDDKAKELKIAEEELVRLKGMLGGGGDGGKGCLHPKDGDGRNRMDKRLISGRDCDILMKTMTPP